MISEQELMTLKVPIGKSGIFIICHKIRTQNWAWHKLITWEKKEEKKAVKKNMRLHCRSCHCDHVYNCIKISYALF